MELEEEQSLDKNVEMQEFVLAEFKVQKDYLWYFKNNYNLTITNKRVVLLYAGGTLGNLRDIKRSISYSKIKGITKTSQEPPICFVLHCRKIEDELLYCNEAQESIEVIKEAFAKSSQKNLPIFCQDSEDLTPWTTTMKDIKIGINRMPLKKERIKDERVFTDEESSEEDQEEKELVNEFSFINKEDASEHEDTSDDEDTDEECRESQNWEIIEREEENMKDGESKLIFTRNTNEIEPEDNSKSLRDFEVLKMIDQGAFGKVFLVRNKHTRSLYAMKRIRKDILIERKQIQHTKSEKGILLNIEHPFLLGMEFVFQNDLRIYFFLDYIKGGNLFDSLRSIKRFSEKAVKFIAAQLVLAIGFLHKNKIVHRDLKPENVLIEENGYVKLADFGVSKFLESENSTYSFCGSKEYIAPEMCQMKGHNFTVDWWTLGILIYELTVGRPPFMSKKNKKLWKIIESREVSFPDPIRHQIEISEDLKDIIVKLLDKSPKTRLGVNGYEEICNHRWFEDIDFNALENKLLDAPYKPDIESLIKNPHSRDYDQAEEMEDTETILDKEAKSLIKNNANKFTNF